MDILRQKIFLSFLIIVFISLLLFAVTVSLVIQSQNKRIVLSKEEIVDFLPQDLEIFENQVTLSPNKKNYAVLTTTDLGMKHSTIWVVTSDGERRLYGAFGDEYRYISTPTWSPDSKKIAYIKVYPFELWILDIDTFDITLLYAESNHEDDNVLNPSLGYGGKTYLEWTNNHTIRFQNNKSLPESLYEINVSTSEVSLVDIEAKPIVTQITSPSSFDYFSQRDPLWADDQLGGCKSQTIYSAGCTITAVTMMLSHFGIYTTPALLNNFLTAGNERGYFNGCDIRWNIVVNFRKGIAIKAAHFDTYDLDLLDYELSQGNAVIVGFDHVPFTGIPHWVMISHKEGDDYVVGDPWENSPDKRMLSDFDTTFNHMIIYEHDPVL